VGDPHACLKAQIGYGPDTVYGNNSCQRNINIQQTSTATYRVQVENNLELPAIMEIVPRGQIDDRWRLEIPTNNFLLDPFSCPRVVPIRLTSPANAQPEEMVHVVLDVFANVFGDRIPQGGVELIGCQHGGEPPTINEGAPIPGGREILVTDERSGLSHYPVRIAISEGERDRLGSAKLMPGMPVEGFIQTGYRTVFSYLTKPLADNMARAFREE